MDRKKQTEKEEAKAGDQVVEKYKSEVDRKFRQRKEQREDVETEWTAFKEVFIGAAEDICGRTSGKPTQT